MKSATVSVAELREVVGKNRTEHKRLYEEALEGYWTMVEDELERLSKQVDAREDIPHYVKLPMRPESHVKDYDRILTMLDMTTVDYVPVDAGDFGRYVMDEWDWKDDFVRTSTTYINNKKG